MKNFIEKYNDIDDDSFCYVFACDLAHDWIRDDTQETDILNWEKVKKLFSESELFTEKYSEKHAFKALYDLLLSNSNDNDWLNSKRIDELFCSIIDMVEND